MSAAIANLDLYRRGVGSGFFSRGALLIENFVRDLSDYAADRFRASLGGILLRIGEGDDVALRYWRRIESLMQFPSRRIEQEDQFILVDALALHYWTRHGPHPEPIPNEGT